MVLIERKPLGKKGCHQNTKLLKNQKSNIELLEVMYSGGIVAPLPAPLKRHLLIAYYG
jgi:hypothetical protein